VEIKSVLKATVNYLNVAPIFHPFVLLLLKNNHVAKVPKVNFFVAFDKIANIYIFRALPYNTLQTNHLIHYFVLQPSAQIGSEVGAAPTTAALRTAAPSHQAALLGPLPRKSWQSGPRPRPLTTPGATRGPWWG
jgi:hypothetical protein